MDGQHREEYDPVTDSLYVVIRDKLAVRTVEFSDGFMIDLAEDGIAVGYDIQHATQKPEIIEQIGNGTSPYYPRLREGYVPLHESHQP